MEGILVRAVEGKQLRSFQILTQRAAASSLGPKIFSLHISDICGNEKQADIV